MTNKKDKVKFKDSRFFKFAKDTVLNVAQVVPGLAPIATSIKENTKENPAGSIKISKTKWIRIALGLVALIEVIQVIRNGGQVEGTMLGPIIEAFQSL
jgi:hypothetical protein